MEFLKIVFPLKSGRKIFGKKEITTLQISDGKRISSIVSALTAVTEHVREQVSTDEISRIFRILIKTEAVYITELWDTTEDSFVTCFSFDNRLWQVSE